MAYNRRPYKSSAGSGEGGTKKKWNGYKRPPVVIRGSAYKKIENPSSEQHAIINDFANNLTACMIVARAGSGKTSTAVEAMKRLPRNKSVLYLVFAKRLRAEAESKCDPHIEVATVHSFGLRALKQAFGSNIQIDTAGEKDQNIARAIWGPEDEKIDLRHNFVQAMDFTKGALCETIEDVKETMDRFDIDTCKESEDDFAKNVLKGLDIAAEQYMRLSYSDMLWMCIRKNITIPQFDYIVGDEMQDASPCRMELLLRACHANTKAIILFDDYQRIFTFAGADEKAIEMFKNRMNPHTLPLYTTFRCSKNVVKLANTICEDYYAAENNQEGTVEDRTEIEMMRDAQPGDFIISRVNAPLISICLQFLKEGRKCKVQGKDLGRSLLWMIKRSEAKNVDEFLIWLSNWKNTECERLAQKNKDSQHIVDKAECLEAFAEGLTDINEMRKTIEKMFDDDDDTTRIVATSTHACKGLERDRCWLLKSTFKVGKNDEEDRIFYVAVTRAKTKLYLVS